MIDAPVAIVLIGSVIQAAGPARRIASAALAHLGLEEQLAEADAALERDPLIVAVASITEIYSRA